MKVAAQVNFNLQETPENLAAALQVILKLQERIENVERENIAFRVGKEQQTLDQARPLFAAMGTNRQLRERIVGLEGQLREKEELTQLNLELQNKIDEVEGTNAGLRDEMAQQALAQNALLDQARRVNDEAQEQLGRLHPLNEQNNVRIADLEMQLHNNVEQKAAAIALSLRLQTRIEELERGTVDLRGDLARQALNHDGLLFNARRINRQVQEQLDRLNELNGQNNVQIANLEDQLHRTLEQKDDLIARIDDLEHHGEMNQHALNDHQHRLFAIDRRIRVLNETIANERVRVHKAIELSDLYIRFYQTKEKVKAIRDCQASLTATARILGVLIGIIGGVVGILFGLFAGGELMGMGSHILNASTIRSLEKERKRLCGRISQIHTQLERGPIPSHLYDSFWNGYS